MVLSLLRAGTSDATSARQPLLPAHGPKVTTVNAETVDTTLYMSCQQSQDAHKEGEQGDTKRPGPSSMMPNSAAASATHEAVITYTTMASDNVLIGQDGRLSPSSLGCSSPNAQLLFRRLHHLTRHSRFLNMAVFALTTAWALWSLMLMLLSTDGRHAFAAPAGTTSTAYRTRPCTADTFSAALPSFASVERVDSVAANGNYGEGTADLGFPSNATNLPPLCAVTVRVQNGTSRYRLALFLPTAAKWNGRILTVGSYSFAGGINWPDMGQGPHYGFATLASDGGHNSSQDALDWMPTTPDRLADWGYRSLHGSIGLGKALTQHYYTDAAIAYSYYSGCSTGGRQGLKEIQIDPQSFDGALVGAPAWDTDRLMPWISRVGAANLRGAPAGDSVLGPAEFSLLSAEALRQCDQLDGHRDSIISRPEACAAVLNVSALGCSVPGIDPNACLSEQQIAVARFMYADAFTAKDEFIHSGYSPGSEDSWPVYLSLGDASDFDQRYERFWLYNDTAWDWPQYSDQTFYDSIAANPGAATADHYDISGFRGRGGKVLLYQGLADGLIMPRMTTHYYNQTLAAMHLTLDKADAADGIQSFFRYFQVPGMQHCFGSAPQVNAPWMFAAPGQATVLLQGYHFGAGWGVPNQPPGAAHDALLALMAWVEHGVAPESIVATAWNGNGSVNRTRPLCVYPEEAVYKGQGDLNAADSWRCQ